MPSMFITLFRPFPGHDGSKGKDDPAFKVDIPAGRYEVERVPCPLGHNCNWLVLLGTKTGATEGSFRQWVGIRWGQFRVEIEE